MREFIQNESQRLQGLMRLFNERGSRMVVFDDQGRRLLGELVDSFTVTRLAPRFDPQGNHTGTDFWLLWKSVGYDNGWQYAHTVKIVKVRVLDTLDGAWLMVDLSDDRDRRMRIELIEPLTEKPYAEDWKRWQAYKADRADMFAPIDADLLEEHLRIAEQWT